LKTAELRGKTAEIGRRVQASEDALRRLAKISAMMDGINRHNDVNSTANQEELKADVCFIVDRMVPGAAVADKNGYARAIFDGMFAAVSKAYQFEKESEYERNNTWLVMDSMGPKKRSRRAK